MNRNCERVSVIELHEAGLKTADIVQTSGFNLIIEQMTLRLFQESDSQCQMTRISATHKIVNRLRCRIRRNPELKIAKWTRRT